MTMTAQDVRSALYRSFSDRWAVVFEVTARGANMAGGRADHIPAEEIKHRRVDALLVRRAPAKRLTTAQRWQQTVAAVAQHRDSLFEVAPAPVMPDPVPAGASNGGIERLAIEIKVTRSDFLSDIRNPDKQAAWRAMAERHAYCVPAGLVQRHEVPAESGLIEVRDNLTVVWTRKAPRYAAPAPLPLAVLLDAFYRWSRAEATTRGLDHAGRAAGNDIDAVRAELARVRHELELAQGHIDRATDQIAMWKRFYAAAATPPPCATCGQPLRPGRRTDPYHPNWVHSKADEAVCKPQREGNHRIYYNPEPAYGWDEQLAAAAAAV